MGFSVIGLVAGAGELPRVFVEQARARGLEVVAARLAWPAGRRSQGAAAASVGPVRAVVPLDPARWEQALAAFQRHGVRDVYVVGKVSRLQASGILEQAAAGEAGRLFREGRYLGDQALSQLFAEALARRGLRLGEQQEVLGDLLAPPGVLTARGPDGREQGDVERGRALARQVAELDVGQAVVLKGGVVLAVEVAAEGTDAAIRRGGRLGGPGAVVVKAARRDQDLRLDTPVVGPGTIRAMASVGASCLAIEAGRCFVVRRDQIVADADRAGICIVAQ